MQSNDDDVGNNEIVNEEKPAGYLFKKIQILYKHFRESFNKKIKIIQEEKYGQNYHL